MKSKEKASLNKGCRRQCDCKVPEGIVTCD